MFLYYIYILGKTIAMSSTSSPNKSSRRTYSSLSCVGKRPDSSVFNSGESESVKIIKRPTIGVESDLLNHRGSGATLDDASSLVDQTTSLGLSPAKTSLAAGSASQSDLEMGHRLNSLTINRRESMHVRTLFRYDPSRDHGLAARVRLTSINFSTFLTGSNRNVYVLHTGSCFRPWRYLVCGERE